MIMLIIVYLRISLMLEQLKILIRIVLSLSLLLFSLISVLYSRAMTVRPSAMWDTNIDTHFDSFYIIVKHIAHTHTHARAQGRKHNSIWRVKFGRNANYTLATAAARSLFGICRFVTIYLCNNCNSNNNSNRDNFGGNRSYRYRRVVVARLFVKLRNVRLHNRDF